MLIRQGKTLQEISNSYVSQYTCRVINPNIPNHIEQLFQDGPFCLCLGLILESKYFVFKHMTSKTPAGCCCGQQQFG